MALVLPKLCVAPEAQPKGICWFDVDGTLTAGEFPSHAKERPPVQACIDAGWDVGVATASNRKWQDVCTPSGDGYKAKGGGGGWMTDAMCQNMAKHGFKTFNSNDNYYGGEALANIRTARGPPGGKKALFISGVMADCFPGIPAVLFDNDPDYGYDARRYPDGVTAVQPKPPQADLAIYCMAAANDPNSCTAGKKGPTPVSNIISLEGWQTGQGVTALLKR